MGSRFHRAALLALTVTAASSPGPGAGSLAAQVPGPAAGPEAGKAGPSPAVPFVSQETLMCGPAALAMVYRAWGVRDVQPGDWAELVRPDEGGVRTDELARAAAAGPPGSPGEGPPEGAWRVRAGSLPDLDALAAAARAGPIVVLVEERGPSSTYHYVVVLAVEDGRVRFHDPATGPDRTRPAREFERAWEEAGRWSLAVAPPERTEAAATAPEREPRASAALLEASRLFRAGRWLDAAAAAGDEAPRLRAAALYLGDRPGPALAAWNALGEARLDLVRIDGLRRTRHPVVERHLDLEPRRPLEPSDLARARRRLAALPSVATARVDYRPVEGGRLVELQAAVVERPSLPGGPLPWAALAADALVNRRLRAGTGVTGAGEWLEMELGFADARRAGLVRLSVPGVLGLPGVVSVEGARVREAHADGDHVVSRAALRVDDWASGRLRWRLGAGLARWDHGAARPFGETELGMRGAGDRVDVGAGLSVNGGPEGSWLGWNAAAAARSAPADGDEGSVGWHAVLWGEGTTGEAPRIAWPGAGTGRVRDRLLRAHPLDEDGLVAGPALAPVLVGGTLEAVHWLRLPVPLRLGGALFVDAAGSPPRGVAGSMDARAPFLVDAGAGLRLALPGLPGVLRMDAARGLMDGSSALSLGWSPPWPGRD